MKNILLAVVAFVALMLFISPVTWAESCHDGGQSLSGEENHQRQQACEAEVRHQCKNADKGVGEHPCKQADKSAGEHPCKQADKSAGEHPCKQADKSAGVEKIMDSYFAILSSLSQNSMDGVRENAETLSESADGLIKQCAGYTGDGVKACSMDPMADVSAAAKSLAGQTDISSARTEFGALSEKLVELQGKQGESPDKLAVFKCDMAKKVWLQENEDPGNPYFGPSMATCRHKLN